MSIEHVLSTARGRLFTTCIRCSFATHDNRVGAVSQGRGGGRAEVDGQFKVRCKQSTASTTNSPQSQAGLTYIRLTNDLFFSSMVVISAGVGSYTMKVVAW